MLEHPANGRSVKPDGIEVRNLRVEKGWGVQDLAQAARCSAATVENVEQGKNVYRTTLSRIAIALGVSYGSLLAERNKEGRRMNRAEVIIKLSIPFDRFDESTELAALIEAIRTHIDTGDTIEVIDVTDGSTVITLRMSEEDAYRLVSSNFLSGYITEVTIKEVHIVPLEEGLPSDEKKDTVNLPKGE